MAGTVFVFLYVAVAGEPFRSALVLADLARHRSPAERAALAPTDVPELTKPACRFPKWRPGPQPHQR
jgi:hypothetical protein